MSLKHQETFFHNQTPDQEYNHEQDTRHVVIGRGELVQKPRVPYWRVIIALILLFTNYFLAQYDKFILSYFQAEVVSSLSMSLDEYGILSGYATGIVFAICAIPVAFISDYTNKRVLVLTIATIWWSLCVVFQGLSHNFWQILLARIGMGIGQAPVEALSISLISDIMDKKWVFLGGSVLYVGVYVGEAISGQIATAFQSTHTSWQVALKAIGITGFVVAVLLIILVREPEHRQTSLPQEAKLRNTETIVVNEESNHRDYKSSIQKARHDFVDTIKYVLRMESFWLITLSAGFRELSGNIFGYYMPGYLTAVYPDESNLLSRYGIIVGIVGSVSVILGGVLTAMLWNKTKMTPLYITGIGGMVSSIFVLLMIFSKSAGNGSESRGIGILYGTMSAAYLTAELWLGALNALLVLLIPPFYKTFALAIYQTVLVLMYSTGPQIMALALRNTDPTGQSYIDSTKILLAVLIPLGYWIAGIGFIFCIPRVKIDLSADINLGVRLSPIRRFWFSLFTISMVCIVIVLFVLSLVYR